MTEGYDRQDKGADHYSDMIRNPARSVKVFNQLIFNERVQKMNLEGIERIRKRNLYESRKAENVYLEKLAELKELKKYSRNSSQSSSKNNNNKSNLLSIAVRNKLSSNRLLDNESSGSSKMVTVYEMHLIDSKKLFTKAQDFIKHLNVPLTEGMGENETVTEINRHSSNTNNEFTGNNIVGIKSFESFRTKNTSPFESKLKSTKSFNGNYSSKTPSTTPIFPTEIQVPLKRKVKILNANKKFNETNNFNSNGRLQTKATPIVKRVQIQTIKKSMITEE